MSVQYVDTPSRPPAQPIIIPPPPRKQIPVLLIWIIAIILIILIILFFTLSARQATGIKTSMIIPQSETIYNLDTLVDLSPNGVCCHLPASPTVTDRYIYLPSTDRTYSLNPSNVAAVCQGLTGQQLTDCQSEISDSSGQLKVVSHRGIKVYYTFAIGQAPTTICQNFQTCPTI